MADNPPPTPNARLCQLLASRFTNDELEQLIAYDKALSESDLAVSVFFKDARLTVANNLIQAATNRELLPALAAAAARARPLVAEAREVAMLFVAAHAVPIVADPARVPYHAGKFNGMFSQQKQRLGQLKTLKDLHDILHQLRKSHGELTRLVRIARQPDYNPIFAGQMPVTLTNWLATVENVVRPKWVLRFTDAAKLVARCVKGKQDAPEDVNRSLDYLGTLPTDEQADLNERLVDAARDLDVDGLDTPLRELQAVLGNAYGNEFQQRYNDFRANCESLRRLIDSHDKCQDVDAALSEAAVLMWTPGATPPRWDLIKERLAEIKKSRAKDAETIGRLIEMVVALAAKMKDGGVPPPDWLPNLQAGFGDYFYELDDKLLDATDRVLRTADVLDFRLKGYSQ